MDKAINEMSFLAVGMYGKIMPKQNGAPIRLIVPWKYGYKSIKSLARIEFVRRQPKTFWNDLAPREYGFFSNVDPQVAHPRWSQENEWLLEKGVKNIKTQKYNGYGDWVGKLYQQKG